MLLVAAILLIEYTNSHDELQKIYNASTCKENDYSCNAIQANNIIHDHTKNLYIHAYLSIVVINE